MDRYQKSRRIKKRAKEEEAVLLRLVMGMG